jgi:hypothetical protein
VRLYRRDRVDPLYYPPTEYQCHRCNKKLIAGSLPLLPEKKYTPPGEVPCIEHRCPVVKILNRPIHGPAGHAQKAVAGQGEGGAGSSQT